MIGRSPRSRCSRSVKGELNEKRSFRKKIIAFTVPDVSEKVVVAPVESNLQGGVVFLRFRTEYVLT